jgi:hypothetical protein
MIPPRSESVARRLAVIALSVAMIGTGIVLCLTVLYFLRGSLEMFPTDEDHAKVRLVMGVIAAILIAVELALWFLLRRLMRSADVSAPEA